jgi:hypothetical protein
MDVPDPAALAAALAGVVVRAWRLHLTTPGVRATVPLLRGVWGLALHDLAPATYADLFDGGPQGVPRYLVRPAPADARPAPAAEFVLFGGADASAAWDAWDRAAAAGLGPRRTPFVVRAVRPLAWEGTPLRRGRAHPGFALAGLPWPAGETAVPCRLEFPAPLRLIYRQRLVHAPTLADLTMALLRRLQQLSAAAGPLWAARADWLALAKSWPAGPWEGARCDLVRYSGRQRRDLTLAGVSGSLALPAGPGPLAALLAAGLWTHLGKGTVFGLGQLRVARAGGPTAREDAP